MALSECLMQFTISDPSQFPLKWFAHSKIHVEQDKPLILYPISLSCQNNKNNFPTPTLDSISRPDVCGPTEPLQRGFRINT